MEKIAFVCVNYGEEIVGGSQYFTRLIAEHLSSYYDVEVLTSSSKDTWTWRNYYSTEKEVLNNVTIRRFNVVVERGDEFAEIDELYQEDLYDDSIEEKWINAVGPNSPDLINYIKDHLDEYKCIFFVTYEYYHAIKGLPIAKEKAIFIPTAHDCRLIKKNLFMNLFNMSKAFVYLTHEEKELCNKLFHNDYIPSKVLGVGVEKPKNIDVESFKREYNLDSYILYIGRIEPAKGCVELFNNFLKYKSQNKNDLKLVIAGKGATKIPEDENIINLGFIDEKTKFEALTGAEFLVLPSKFESLSMVVLEAMSVKTPVLVNSECLVLKGHSDKSNGGLYFKTYEEFENILNFFNKYPNIYNALCDNAYKYIEDNYNWDIIIDEYLKLIDAVFVNI